MSRFWILLSLAAVIAAIGVVSDSTATVIGAMIVAPLMIPIQGTMLAAVIGDRRNLFVSMGLVAAGALAAIAIGFLVAVVVPSAVTAAANSQVAGRVNPSLLDLMAALATGAVGSIALIRRDISDTLPGVAIAISLVPPLSVVGITLEAGEAGQAWGAFLLFITNVAAILGVGAVVMAVYGVHRMIVVAAEPGGRPISRRNAVVGIAVLFVVVAVQLSVATAAIIRQRNVEYQIRAATEQWGRSNDWELLSLRTDSGETLARLAGPLPLPDTDMLRTLLVSEGVDPSAITVELVPIEKIVFDAKRDDDG
jgi:uncharacterized hydrophobic protein (TIGR00271 family)